LVWKLDRFARSLKHLVNALAEFDALGVAFISLRDNLDLTAPSGRLMFQIVGLIGAKEIACAAASLFLTGDRPSTRSAISATADVSLIARTIIVLAINSAQVEELRRLSFLHNFASSGESGIGCSRSRSSAVVIGVRLVRPAGFPHWPGRNAYMFPF